MDVAIPQPVVWSQPINDASAWRAADFAQDRSWIVTWSNADLTELEAALRHARGFGMTADTVTRDCFPLPTLSPRLAALRRELEYGRGFTLLRGIRRDRYDDADAGLLFRGIGCHFGDVVAQNAKGDVLGHVRDLGYEDYRGRSDVRGYQTRARLEFHTDVVDIVGLMCLRAAREGGHSLIVSSTTVHNEMLMRLHCCWGALRQLPVRPAWRGVGRRDPVFHQPGVFAVSGTPELPASSDRIHLLRRTEDRHSAECRPARRARDLHRPCIAP